MKKRMTEDRPILLVEDDNVDIMTARRAFKDLKIKNPLCIVTDGEMVLEYLNTHGDCLPFIILLDLKLPKMSGLDVLVNLKEEAFFKNIPVIILSASDEPKDRSECFNKGAAGFMLKQADYLKMVETFDIIYKYWTLGRLPV